MNYAIFRSEPIYTLNDLAQIGSHNKREKKAYKSNPDIDLSKTKDNVELVPLNMKYVKGFYEITKEYKKEHEERMKNEREDRRRTFRQMVDKSKSVVADEMIFTASHNFFNDMPKEKVLEWSEYCMAFVKEYLGYKDEQILHATLHMDEKTPHIHCVVVPLIKKIDKRTNTERYTISKKQYIHDKEHLSELQDKYCELLNLGGFALERGQKHSAVEHLNMKEFKRATQEVNKELTSRSNKLDQAITDLEIKMESNKPVLFEKESIKIKKDTFDSMNKVIEESKKISEMKPKLDNTYKAMKEQINKYSKVQQENYDLKDENETLKFQNTKLSNRVSILENTITVLKRTIERVSNFFYHLVADGLIPKKKEEEINNILGNDYKPYKEKSRDDGLSL